MTVDRGEPRMDALDGGFELIPLLDDLRLGRLRTVLPDAQFRSIIQAYLDTDFFAELTDTFREDGFVEMVHNCKGTSANLGALRLRAVAERLELACRAGNAPAMSHLLPELRRITVLTHGALASMAGLQ